MTSAIRRLLLLAMLSIAAAFSSGSGLSSSHVPSLNSNSARPASALLLRGGATKSIQRNKSKSGDAVKKTVKRKKHNTKSFLYMWKCFFVTLVDPTYIEDNTEGMISTVNGKKSLKSSNPSGGFGVGGAVAGIGAPSFGPVCGPNGCH